jgi:hypothetical protein
LYYLLEGRMEFYCDDEVLSVGAGEVSFLPQGKAHAFYIRSPIVKALILVQATGERSWDWTGISSTWANRRQASNCRTIKPRTSCPTRHMPPGSRPPTASESCHPKRLQNCCRTIPASELIRIRQRVERQNAHDRNRICTERRSSAVRFELPAACNVATPRSLQRAVAQICRTRPISSATSASTCPRRKPKRCAFSGNQSNFARWRRDGLV